jgi:hypothetical protein
MSLKSRLDGIGAGIAMGALAPLLLPISVRSFFTRNEHARSNPSSMLIVVGILTALAGLLVVGAGIGLATLLSPLGLPWFVTVPGFYLLGWGLLGAFAFNTK